MKETPLWDAQKSGAEDHYKADIRLQPRFGSPCTLDIMVCSTTAQCFGPDTALSMAAALIKWVAETKGSDPKKVKIEVEVE